MERPKLGRLYLYKYSALSGLYKDICWRATAVFLPAHNGQLTLMFQLMR